MAKDLDLQDEGGGAAGAAAAPLITSRFLFVDVAAQRAKQLRRGAVPKVERASPTPGPLKLERVAMEEVRKGLIDYTLPTNFEGPGRGGRT
jgi:DNA-directed RNA polymerase subunit K/omega